MMVMEVIADILKQEGAQVMFCYPTTPVIEAAAAAGIRPILCRQERVGVDMADGYARVTDGRVPSVFAMQYGPGAENAYSGIATAYSDSVPILLLPLAHGRDVAQVYPAFQSVPAYGPITKFAEQISLPDQVRDVTRRALNALRNGRHAPVMIELPLDVVQAEVSAATVPHASPPTARSAADWSDVEHVAELLLGARNPMILAGQGVLYARASAELVALAELLQVPVATTYCGKSGFPENHPLALGAAGAAMTGEAYHYLHASDLILGVGTSFTRHWLSAPEIPAGKRLVQITTDPRDFNKSYPMEALLQGDARLVLGQLHEALAERARGRRADGAVAATIAAQRQAWLARWAPKLRSPETPMTPYRVIAEFMRVVDPAEAIVTHDSGSPRDQIMPFYVATTPRSYLGWGKSHALGTGLGLTIGAKVAAPDKFCVNFMGDAAFGMTGLDFETAVRNNIPILTVVLNNSTMAIETQHLRLSHQLYRTRDIGGNYAALARDLGGWSERVTDPAEVAAAFLRARRKTEEGQAALLEFMTCAETAFSHRKGAAT